MWWWKRPFDTVKSKKKRRRHFVKDRFELSGMRWEQSGAENLLRLRVVAENGDWDDYHLFRRQQRHQRLYATPLLTQSSLEFLVLEQSSSTIPLSENSEVDEEVLVQPLDEGATQVTIPSYFALPLVV